MRKPPVVEIPKAEDMYETNWYNGVSYRADDLHTLAKDCKEFDMPLAGIDINNNPWGEQLDSLSMFIWHMNRVKSADLEWPIVLSPEGCILDGYHRICKAIIERHNTIKAVRLDFMPISIKEQNEEDTE